MRHENSHLQKSLFLMKLLTFSSLTLSIVKKPRGQSGMEEDAELKLEQLKTLDEFTQAIFGLAVVSPSFCFGVVFLLLETFFLFSFLFLIFNFLL